LKTKRGFVKKCLIEKKEGREMFGFISNKLMFPGVSFKASAEQRQSILFVEHVDSKKVLLYSHGNCASLPQIASHMKRISYLLGLSVCAYEYPGYLDGNGSTEALVDVAANQALEWLFYVKGYEASSIVLMGRSIGTGPILRLASREPKNRYAGIILQSPFTSIRELGEEILRPLFGCMFCPALLHSWVIGNRYDNLASIRGVDKRTPILFVHGERDKVIPVSMTHALIEESHKHEDHVVHIQERSTHNTFDEATLFLYMMTFVKNVF
jgi:fermentation-respiration switch protein FrsA (DUF1100 family)